MRIDGLVGFRDDGGQNILVAQVAGYADDCRFGDRVVAENLTLNFQRRDIFTAPTNRVL